MLPLLLAGAGAGSTLLSSLFAGNAQDEVNAARASTFGAERGRQGALDAEAAGVNSGALQRYAGFDTQMADRAKTLGDFYKSAVGAGTVLPGSTVPASTSDLVNREIDNRMAIAKAFGVQQGEAKGNLQSFGDLLGRISLNQARDAGTLSQIGGYKKGSAGVNALEMDAASHAGDSEKQLADLFAGLGKVGLSAGLSGALAPVAAGATAAVGAPLNILPAAAQASSAWPTAVSPFLTYGA